MNKRSLLKTLSYPLISGLLLSTLASCQGSNNDTAASENTPKPAKQFVIEARVKPVLVQDGLKFKDLNSDGLLNPYEDWRLPEHERVEDLLGRMTLAEKAGLMLHSTLVAVPDENAIPHYIAPMFEAGHGAHVTSFVTGMTADPEHMGKSNDRLQERAEAARLGIPLTISSDPRNHFDFILGASNIVVGFSQWPEPMGFAALGDIGAVEQFADITRQEYRSVGIHMALSPQADLATEPRWPRQVATFGSTPEKASPLIGAYVRGFQGSDTGLSRGGVATITKHWVGYGAAIDGWDAHNYYGRFADLPDAALEAHMRAFDDALAAKSAGIMPSYSIAKDAVLDGEELEQVGTAFSEQLLSGELREKRGYDGLILSDWMVTADCGPRCLNPTESEPQDIPFVGAPWGVRELSMYQRFVKGIRAGIDQFGGINMHNPDFIIDAVNKGDVSEARIDQSAKRVLAIKFQLGLFENPYADLAAAKALTNAKKFKELALQTQRSAQVLIENKHAFLPVASGKKKVWTYGVEKEALVAAGLNPVSNLAEADFAIVRAHAPKEQLHPHHFFGRIQDEGRLDFRDGDPAYEALKEASSKVPTVFDIFLDRAAILSNIQDKATALIGNFGASDEALLAIILGKDKPLGKLPYQLPSSMQAVEQQHPALPNDDKDPLYPAGHGLSL